MRLGRSFSLSKNSVTKLLHTNVDRPKTAILMLNMGGPETTEDVFHFLLRLFNDREVIWLPFQRAFASWVARRRAPIAQEKYNEIGGGSPLIQWATCQGKGLVRVLDRISPETGPHKYYLGMRYVHPLTEEAINEIEDDGVERVVAFSQFPQYSCTTSGSSFNAIAAHYNEPVSGGLAGIDSIPPPRSQTGEIPKPPGTIWSFLDRWPTAMPEFAEVLAENIRHELSHLPPTFDKENTIILFSAHSIPMWVVNRGDPYIQATTVHAVMEKLNFALPYRLVWQSKVGPGRWMGQDTANALRGLARLGRKHVVIVPIAFTSEHIETLHEMDINYCSDLAREVGMASVRRASAPNDHPLFIQGMANLVARHLRSGEVASRQFFLRCPGCTNDRCSKVRHFIAGEAERLRAWTRSQAFHDVATTITTYRKVL
ncbi:Ferrochelatase [Echinococcus granulosus]|uniref:Ferrochelatase n=1 Tax=Echinococcus granulosus TaxID=6210 RepID=W6UIV4_ECHGR|nr:Ferrochelatase [Echinococcus granulosus]EUB60948.1 Ferrochelatase [Echinococcus granulosus]